MAEEIKRKFGKYYFKARIEYESDTPVGFETNDLKRDCDKLINWINLHINNSKKTKYSIGGIAEAIISFVTEYKKTDDFKNEINKAKRQALKKLLEELILKEREVFPSSPLIEEMEYKLKQLKNN